MGFVLSKRSLDKMIGVHPQVIQVMKAAITNSPYDFLITHGVRTAAEQNRLYQQGRKTKGPRVTNADGYKVRSNHQAKSDGLGYAVDIALCGEVINGKYVKYTNTPQMYNDKKMRTTAAHIKRVAASLGIPLQWGGDWKFYDSPHFELKK